jgi:hypothetical protein
LDAIPPDELLQIVRDAICRHIDDDEIEAAARKAKKQAASIHKKLGGR